MKKNEHGFGATGVIIITLVIAAIVGSGYLVLQRGNKVKPTVATSTTTTTKPTSDPYAGWNAYTLKYEKASFKYPSSWELKDTSFGDTKTTGGGVDIIALSGSDGFEMNIITGGPNDYGQPFGGLSTIYTQPVAFASKQAYINFGQTGAGDSGIVDKMDLTVSKNITDFPTDKNVKAPSYKDGVTENKLLILMDYDANVDKSSANPVYPHTPLATVLKDSNYLEAKLVIRSFAY